ncbi:chaperonin 10-like protein [Vararia minispora EC-137]|uniref:Chaperonin 10-like protein n=1 Tax=Vararia minispora EC-137 TaxID=1314806 RepID=A0ACB8QRF7_9AGAM|nr:chaperonin 10-like protein [Vararia minispora EC-137]
MSSSGLQKAVVIGLKGDISLQRTPIPEPGPDDILVKIVTAAQNPSDWMAMQRGKVAGAILGCDFAGTVHCIGSAVPEGQRTIGERVAGFVLGADGPGTFAEYVAVPAHFIVPIPQSWSFEDASQLGLTPFTALQALYESIVGLPLPTNPTTDAIPILIYGASTSVGIFAVQFAKLAGLRVIATASRANFGLVKSIGADEIFDYKDPEMARQIKDTTRGRLEFAVDCIANEQTLRLVSDALSDDGGQVAAVLPGVSTRANVKVTFNLIYEWIGKDYDLPWEFRATSDHRERGERFANMFSDLIAQGKIKPGPVRVLPNGLAGVADGIQYMLDGKVSGQKLVYCIADTVE